MVRSLPSSNRTSASPAYGLPMLFFLKHAHLSIFPTHAFIFQQDRKRVAERRFDRPCHRGCRIENSWCLALIYSSLRSILAGSFELLDVYSINAIISTFCSSVSVNKAGFRSSGQVMLSCPCNRYYEPLRLPIQPVCISLLAYSIPLVLQNHRIGSPVLHNISSATCHP